MHQKAKIIQPVLFTTKVGGQPPRGKLRSEYLNLALAPIDLFSSRAEKRCLALKTSFRQPDRRSVFFYYFRPSGGSSEINGLLILNCRHYKVTFSV